MEILSKFGWEMATHLIILGVGMIIPGTLRWYRLKKLKPRIESVYKDLKRVVEPETLDQDHLGNSDHMRAHSRDDINLLWRRLDRARLYPPVPMDNSVDSGSLWFKYLGQIRVEIN